MKLPCCATLLALASVLATGVPQKALADSQVEISYEEPSSAELLPIYEQLKAQGALSQTICYEVIDQVAKLVKQHSPDPAYQQILVNGAFIQTALHNMSLGVFAVAKVRDRQWFAPDEWQEK
jgi:hypothetical protein